MMVREFFLGMSPGAISQALTSIEGTWEAIIVTGEEPPPEYVCPYCGAVFATKEELLAHIESEHPGEPPPNGEAPEWEKYLKWGLIGGGILVFAVAVRSGLKRGGK